MPRGDYWARRTREENEEHSRRAAEGLRRTWAGKTPEEIREHGKAISTAYYNKPVEERNELSRRISNTVKEIWRNKPETYGKERDERIGRSISKYWASRSPEQMAEHRKRMSELQTAAWARLTSEKRDQWVSNAIRGQKRKPSMPEFLLDLYLSSNFPKRWIYNGDGGGGLVIGKKVPDFFRSDGTKEVIEVLGALGYYHSVLDDDIKIQHYAKYSYRCIILWETECYIKEDLDKVFKAV